MDKILVTDIRLSVIAGNEKHVAVQVDAAQAVKKSVGAGLFADLVQFAETVLSLHGDAEKVEIGFDEKTQKVTISPETTASAMGTLSKGSSESDAKDKTIADLKAQIEQLKSQVKS